MGLLDTTSSIFDRITEKYDQLVRGSSVVHWTKENLTSFITLNIESHKNLEYVYGLVNPKEMTDWFKGAQQPWNLNLKDPARMAYDIYFKSLRSKAQANERKMPFNSLKEAHHAYIDILTTLLKNVNDIVNEKVISFKSVTLSQVSILGLLKDSERVINFSTYTYTTFVKAAAGLQDTIPKYRIVFMAENAAEVADTVNKITDKEGPYEFLAMVKELKKHQSDFVLGNMKNMDGGLGTGALFAWLMSVSSGMAWVIITLAVAGLSYFILKHGPVIWDDFWLAINNKRKEEKVWMESHVALLRMDLQGMNKADPQYAKLEAIILAYDQKITEYDEKIRAYEDD